MISRSRDYEGLFFLGFSYTYKMSLLFIMCNKGEEAV